jgi:hypothetical protein
MDEVLVFKLVTGEEMLAKVVESDMFSWTLNKPMTLVPSNGGLAMTLGLYTGNPDKPVTLLKSGVIMTSVPRGDLVSTYIESTTGIKTFTKPDILLG